MSKTSVAPRGIHTDSVRMSLGLCEVQSSNWSHREGVASLTLPKCVCSALNTVNGPEMPGNAEQVQRDLLTQGRPGAVSP